MYLNIIKNEDNTSEVTCTFFSKNSGKDDVLHFEASSDMLSCLKAIRFRLLRLKHPSFTQHDLKELDFIIQFITDYYIMFKKQTTILGLMLRDNNNFLTLQQFQYDLNRAITLLENQCDQLPDSIDKGEVYTCLLNRLKEQNKLLNDFVESIKTGQSTVQSSLSSTPSSSTSLSMKRS